MMVMVQIHVCVCVCVCVCANVGKDQVALYDDCVHACGGVRVHVYPFAVVTFVVEQANKYIGKQNINWKDCYHKKQWKTLKTPQKLHACSMLNTHIKCNFAIHLQGILYRTNI